MNLRQKLAAKLLRAFAKRMKAKFTYDAAQYPLRAVAVYPDALGHRAGAVLLA